MRTRPPLSLPLSLPKGIIRYTCNRERVTSHEARFEFVLTTVLALKPGSTMHIEAGLKRIKRGLQVSRSALRSLVADLFRREMFNSLTNTLRSACNRTARNEFAKVSPLILAACDGLTRLHYDQFEMDILNTSNAVVAIDHASIRYVSG